MRLTEDERRELNMAFGYFDAVARLLADIPNKEELVRGIEVHLGRICRMMDDALVDRMEDSI